ncbi:MAG: geranylgeranyl reductase family protein [Nitrospirota bacterium]
MEIATEVLVVGGGPAGSTAAAFLADKGIETILLEKNPSNMKPCGGGIPSVAFEEFDIPEEQIIKEVDTIKLISPNDNAVAIKLDPQKICIVERMRFDSCLRGRAKALGAELLKGEFIRTEKRKKAYLSKIIKDGVEIEIKSGYLIAADGVNSKVRLSQGLKPPPSIFAVTERISDIKTEHCEFWLSSSHAQNFYSWVFPAADGISAGTGGPEPRKIKYLLETFKQRKRLNKYKGNTSIYRIPVWKGDLYNKGNIIFAGDSAGQVMPMSYEGIYYAMKSGEFAAEAIIKGDAARYRKIWKGSLYRKFLLMSELNSYFLKNDANAEKLVSLHKNPKLQEAAKTLWLMKDPNSESLQNYIKLLGKILI